MWLILSIFFVPESLRDLTNTNGFQIKNESMLWLKGIHHSSREFLLLKYIMPSISSVKANCCANCFCLLLMRDDCEKYVTNERVPKQGGVCSLRLSHPHHLCPGTQWRGHISHLSKKWKQCGREPYWCRFTCPTLSHWAQPQPST